MNELARPPGTPARYLRQWLMYAAIALAGIVVVMIFFVIERPAKIDENLCPVDSKPTRQTILFLDTSDPLTPKHHAELERLVTELQQPGVNPDTEDFYIAPGEALIVYKLALSWHNLQPFMEVCNPGDNPDDWDWKKDLTRGKAFALRNWKRFEDRIKELFPKEPEAEMPRSPILVCWRTNRLKLYAYRRLCTNSGAGTLDFVENLLACRVPSIRLRSLVALDQIELDLLDQLPDATETASTNHIARQISEEPFDQIHP